jgi:hypothetical protein
VINRQELLRIVAETMCDPRTVERAYEGRTTTSATMLRIVAAAAKLGIEVPPAVAQSAAGVKP